MIESDQRFTPQHVLDVVREFDRIVLDPCTTHANPVGAPAYYWLDGEHSSLSEDWATWCDEGGVCFMNPPYSRGQLWQFVDKLIAETHRVPFEAIALVPADPSTNWARLLLRTAQGVAYWNKRIAFAKADGSTDAGAKQPSAFYYFGERVERFRRVFSPHATVLNLRAAR